MEHRLSKEERICDACGAVMEKIGKEVNRSLKPEPARFWLQEDVYYTYACKQCEAVTGGRRSPKRSQKARILLWQLRLSGGDGPQHYDQEICQILAPCTVWSRTFCGKGGSYPGRLWLTGSCRPRTPGCGRYMTNCTGGCAMKARRMEARPPFKRKKIYPGSR